MELNELAIINTLFTGYTQTYPQVLGITFRQNKSSESFDLWPEK